MPTEGFVRLYLAHDSKSRKRMRASLEKPRGSSWEAISEIQPITNSNLVLVRIHTGVTHQVRVTLASLGKPIVGDEIYSKTQQLATKLKPLSRETKKSFSRLSEIVKKNKLEKPWGKRLCLHALSLRSPKIKELRDGLMAPVPVVE